ncbi:MAG: hypothetical protein GY810_00530 [Aureispira sp.]|nr:hypothetical protein [Aureispira sp.]
MSKLLTTLLFLSIGLVLNAQAKELPLNDLLCEKFRKDGDIYICECRSITPLGWSKDGLFAYELSDSYYEMNYRGLFIVDVKRNEVVASISNHSDHEEANYKNYKKSLLGLYEITQDKVKFKHSRHLEFNGEKYRFGIYSKTQHIPSKLVSQCKRAEVIVKKTIDESIVYRHHFYTDLDGETSGSFKYIGYSQSPYQKNLLVLYSVIHEYWPEGDDLYYKPKVLGVDMSSFDLK